MLRDAIKKIKVFIELGKIVGVWGVKGWVKLHSYTRNRGDIAEYRNWWLQAASENHPPSAVKVLNCREQGAGVVAQLEGINDRDQALALNGQHIFVKETDLPALPDGQFYWQQLIGLNVFQATETGGQGLGIGRLASILETGANDVLVVKDSDQSKAEILIPYTDDVVKLIDLELGIMLVDWDPGYLID